MFLGNASMVDVLKVSRVISDSEVRPFIPFLRSTSTPIQTDPTINIVVIQLMTSNISAFSFALILLRIMVGLAAFRTEAEWNSLMRCRWSPENVLKFQVFARFASLFFKPKLWMLKVILVQDCWKGYFVRYRENKWKIKNHELQKDIGFVSCKECLTSRATLRISWLWMKSDPQSCLKSSVHKVRCTISRFVH
jgi:hypothetical protein